MPPVLKSILNKWCKVSPMPYLLFDTHMGPLSSVTLNQRINKLFKNKVSVNQLRHSYLTDNYAASNKAVINDLANMGTSMAQATTYIKN